MKKQKVAVDHQRLLPVFGLLAFIAITIFVTTLVSATPPAAAAPPCGRGGSPPCTPTPGSATVTPGPTNTPVTAGCTSPTDCLSKMTLREKIGQMTQADQGALVTDNDIATYALGSLLSGGGGGPNGAGGTATQWADMYDGFQRIAVNNSRLHIPLIYGVDAVHGHSNVHGALIFPHPIAMGATRNPALVQQAQHITALEVAGTGIDLTFAPCLCFSRDQR